MPDAIDEAVSGLWTKLQGWVQATIKMAPNVVIAALIVALGGVAARYAGRGAQAAIRRLVGDNEALVSLVGSITRLLVITIGLFTALSVLHLERTVTSLLAGIGVVGLALGFAFQDIAANFMSGAFLAVHGPFRAGDIVEISGRVGTVREISLRRTMLRTFDGLNVIIPNKEVFEQTIVNYTLTQERRVVVPAGVAYGDDLERTRAVVCAAFEGFDWRDSTREVEVIFTEFGDSSINFELRFWLDHASQQEYLVARSEAIIRIKRALDEAGLTIPFPIRTLDFGADAVGGQRLDAMRLRFAPRAGAPGPDACAEPDAGPVQ